MSAGGCEWQLPDAIHNFPYTQGHLVSPKLNPAPLDRYTEIEMRYPTPLKPVKQVEHRSGGRIVVIFSLPLLKAQAIARFA